MIIKIESQQDLSQAAQLVSWLNRPYVDKVLILLPWLNKKEQYRSEKVLHYLFNDCGCLWAGPAFLISFALIFTTRMLEGGFSWKTLGFSLLISFCVAFVAKFLGLGWSFWRLKAWFQRMTFSQEDDKILKLKGG